MRTNIDIPEIIASLVIFLNFYIISILPLGYLLRDYIYYIQIFIFVIYFIIKLDLYKFLNYTFNDNKYILFNEIILGLIFLSITLIISFGNNSDIKSISKIITYVLFFIVFFNFYSYSLISNPKFFDLFLKILVIVGLINSLVGWYFLLSGISPNSQYSGFHLGLFNHPNTNSFIYSISLPIIFYKIIFNKKKNYLIIFIFIFQLITMLFTFSRSTFISVAVALLVITSFKSKKIAISFTIVVVILLFTVLDYFLLAKGSFSSFSRLLLFYTAYEMIVDSMNSFLFGYGVFRSLDLFFTEKLFVGSFEVVVDPHNVILLLGIQFGMIVTIFYVVFVFLVAISGLFRMKLANVEVQNGIVLSFAIVLNLIIQNQFEDILMYPEYFVYPIFLIFLGYLYHSHRFKNINANI